MSIHLQHFEIRTKGLQKVRTKLNQKITAIEEGLLGLEIRKGNLEKAKETLDQKIKEVEELIENSKEKFSEQAV